MALGVVAYGGGHAVCEVVFVCCVLDNWDL